MGTQPRTRRCRTYPERQEGNSVESSVEKRIETALRRRDAILDVVHFAAQRFLETSDWDSNIYEVLERLGDVTGASRVYIFENDIEPDGSRVASLTYEWTAPGIASHLSHPSVSRMAYSTQGFDPLGQALVRGKTVCGSVKRLASRGIDVPFPEDSLSVLAVPISVKQEWWGFIGFDDCQIEREWMPAESEAIATAASMLGSAIDRIRMSKVLIATLRISEAAHSAQDLDELYRLIHEIISELMPARSLYIALYDTVADVLSFPYFVDEYDEPVPPKKPGRGMTEYVLRTGEALLASPDVFEDLCKRGEIELVGTPSIDWLGVPLQTLGQTFGVLVVQSYTKGVRFSDSDKDILGFVSNQVAMAIERKQAEQALQRQLEELSVLHAVATAAAGAIHEDELIERATQVIGKSFYPDNFGLLLRDSQNNVLRIHPSYRGVPDEAKKALISLDEGVTGRVVSTGKPVSIPDVNQDPDYIRIRPDIRSELCVPIKIGERVIGAINAEMNEFNAFTEADERLLVTLASQLATAIERQRTEDALRASEELYRNLVETSPDGVTLTDIEGRVLICNQQFASALGYEKPEELIGKDIYGIIAPEDRKKAIAVGELALEERKRVGGEYNFIKSDGSHLPFELNASLVTDAGGKPKGFIAISRDISERRRRDHEREAIIAVAAALRSAASRAEMLPIILDNVMDLLKAKGVAFVSCDGAYGQEGEPVAEICRGCWSHLTGSKLVKGENATHHVIETGSPFTRYCAQSQPSPNNISPFTGCNAIVALPLMAQGHAIGVLWVGREGEINQDEMGILAAIGDMAANAIHRATLHEQTQRRVQRLAALRSVDMAISASLDLRVALNVLIDQLTVQLNVDASAVLLFNSQTRTLDYAAGRGFRTTGIHRTRVRLGDGLAGRAVLEQQTFHVDNLEEQALDFLRERGFTSESFVSYYALPLSAKGQLKGLLEIYHRSRLTPDTEWLDFLETMAGQAAIAIDNATLFNELQRSNMELALAYDTTLEGWVHALDLRDQETEGHTQRVIEMTVRLAKAISHSDSELVHVRRGVLLHDIGKIAIPDSILQKPGPLDNEEWEIMRRHPEYAYELLSPIAYLRPAIDIPYCHHEKWDGTGYPRGLKGEQIPLIARVFAVVDVWDALRSDRPYRKGWAEDKVKEYICQQSGKHFDPQVTALFLPMLEELKPQDL